MTEPFHIPRYADEPPVPNKIYWHSYIMATPEEDYELVLRNLARSSANGRDPLIESLHLPANSLHRIWYVMHGLVGAAPNLPRPKATLKRRQAKEQQNLLQGFSGFG